MSGRARLGSGVERSGELRAGSTLPQSARAADEPPGRRAKAPFSRPDKAEAAAVPPTGLEVLTLGHSTRTFAEFLTLLRGASVDLLVDVRRMPRSRRNPPFDRDALRHNLPGEGVEYRHEPGLGGLRTPRPDSKNVGWRNASFRGYADYMESAEFEQALLGLIALAVGRRAALMCAEAVPWRCHRSLISDALAVRGVSVRHILRPGGSEAHRLTAFARVVDGRLSYPLGRPQVEPLEAYATPERPERARRSLAPRPAAPTARGRGARPTR